MSKCKCEHWETCPMCYPQGFDEQGNKIPAMRYKTRDELLDENAKLRRLIREVAIPAMRKADTDFDLSNLSDKYFSEALAQLKEAVE